MKIFVVRHGQSVYNLKNLVNDYPEKDVHLTSLGINQSEDLARKLKDRKFDVIFVSEFPRARETADIINKYHNILINVDPRLNERKTGFDGRLESEFEKAVEKDRFHIKPKNGESWQEEKKRLFSFLDDIKKNRYESVLVVTHGDNMLIIKGYFKKLSDQEMWNLSYPDNCEIIEYEA